MCFVFSFQEVKSQQSDTCKSVSPKEDGPIAHPETEIQSTLSFSSFQQPLLLMADLMV